MIIDDIRLLEDIDTPKIAPFHHCRPLEIITDNGHIFTPYKTTNRNEYIARSEIPILKTLSSEITSNFKLLDNDLINGFYSGVGKTFNELIGTIKQFNDITKRSKLRISIFQPVDTILKLWNNEQKIDFADKQAEYLQHKLGSELITYPFLDLPLSEYISFINKRYNGNEKSSTIFTLDMKMNPMVLKQILNHLRDKKEPMIIALIHRKYSNTITQHIIIDSYFNNPKMVFMACQVDRINDEVGNISNTHAITIASNFDIVALKQFRGFTHKPKLELNKIKFFAPETLRIDNLETTFQQRNIISEFNLSSNDYLDLIHLTQIVNGRNGAKINLEKYSILFYLARVHEAITSDLVFSKEREMILKKTIKTHIFSTELQNVPEIQNMFSTP